MAITNIAWSLMLTLFIAITCAGADDVATLATLSKGPYLGLRNRIISNQQSLGEPSGILQLVVHEAIGVRRSHPDVHQDLNELEGLAPVLRPQVRMWNDIVERRLPPRAALFLYSEVLLFDAIDLTVRTGNPEQDVHSNIEGEFIRRGFWSRILKLAHQSTDLTDEQKDELVLTINARYSYEKIQSWVSQFIISREYSRVLDILRRLEARKANVNKEILTVVREVHDFSQYPNLIEADKKAMANFRRLEVEMHVYIINNIDLSRPGDRVIAEALTTSLVNSCEEIMDYEAMLGLDLLSGLVTNVQERWTKEGDQAQIARLQATRERMSRHVPDPKRFVKTIP